MRRGARRSSLGANGEAGGEGAAGLDERAVARHQGVGRSSHWFEAGEAGAGGRVHLGEGVALLQLDCDRAPTTLQRQPPVVVEGIQVVEPALPDRVALRRLWL